jgi:hypothetical protein
VANVHAIFYGTLSCINLAVMLGVAPLCGMLWCLSTEMFFNQVSSITESIWLERTVQHA